MPLCIPGVVTAENSRRATPLWKVWDREAQKEGSRKTIFWPGGEQYKGSWKDNKRHGKGELIYKNNAKYEGDWADGLRHGMGTLWAFEDGKYKVKYNGMWENDVPNGMGVYYDSNGNMYEGEWLAGKRHGRGKMSYKTDRVDGFGGDVYEGNWQDDKRHGKGTMTFASNNVYEGHWQDDMRSGMGTLFYTDRGMRFDGRWVDDKPTAGTYSEIEASPAGRPGALPVLELKNASTVVHRAVYNRA